MTSEAKIRLLYFGITEFSRAAARKVCLIYAGNATLMHQTAARDSPALHQGSWARLLIPPMHAGHGLFGCETTIPAVPNNRLQVRVRVKFLHGRKDDSGVEGRHTLHSCQSTATDALRMANPSLEY